MRDPNRISRILELLKEAWKLVPDWRLGELISNLLGPGSHDIFQPQDEDWEIMLKEFIKNLKK